MSGGERERGSVRPVAPLAGGSDGAVAIALPAAPLPVTRAWYLDVWFQMLRRKAPRHRRRRHRRS